MPETKVSEETKTKWKEKIAAVIKAQQLKLITLNSWELDFILNLEYRMNHVGTLSIQQSINLNKIYGRIN